MNVLTRASPRVALGTRVHSGTAFASAFLRSWSLMQTFSRGEGKSAQGKRNYSKKVNEFWSWGQVSVGTFRYSAEATATRSDAILMLDYIILY